MSKNDTVPPESRGRWPRALLGVALGSALAFGAAEGVLRYLLFGQSDFARERGAALRKPGYFCDPNSDPDYHKLMRLWSPKRMGRGFVNRDPKLGWLAKPIQSPGYGHVDERMLGERRPFLFYGDSFTACVIPSKDCWQGLLEETPFAAELKTVNYGTCAFGIDQTCLLFSESIEHWLRRKPIVAVGILVDNDLDRTVFDFRGCPKPIYALENGELSVTFPGVEDIDEWIEEHPPRITSYLVRYLVHYKRILPASWGPPRSNDPVMVARKKEISRALIESVRAELESCDLEYFFVLFYGPKSWSQQRVQGWRDEFLVETLDSLEIPWVSTRLALQDSARRQGRALKDVQDDYFLPPGKNFGGHYTRLGNEAALPAILRGLCGQYDGAVAKKPTTVETPLPDWALGER